MKSQYLWKALLHSAVIDDMVVVNPDNIPVVNFNKFQNQCYELLETVNHTTIYSSTSSDATINLITFMVKTKYHSGANKPFDTVDIIDVDDLDQNDYFSFNEIFIQDAIELICL